MNKSKLNFPILAYHHISKLSDNSVYQNVTPEEFDRQMTVLSQKGFHCLSLSEIINIWEQGGLQPERSFALTLDDGYSDSYKYAFPILKKFGFSATIFIIVNMIEERNNNFLSWEEIGELAKNNIAFGSHTMSHPRLSQLDDRTIEWELAESKKVIEDRLDQPTEVLAYPYVFTNQKIQDIACRIGYRAACGMTQGPISLFNLRRERIKNNESNLTFNFKINGKYSRNPVLRKFIKLILKFRNNH